MRIRAAFSRLLCAALLAALTPLAASAGAWPLSPGQWSSELSGARFSSDDYHDLQGTRTTMARGGLLESRSLQWSNELGWKKNVSFAFTLPFDGVTRRLGNGSGATETGFGDLYAGFRWRLAGASSSVVSLQADWKAPLGYSRLVGLTPAEIAALDATSLRGLSAGDSANYVRQAGRPRLGDGEQSFQGMLVAGFPMPGLHAFLELGGGYRYYMQHVANQALVSANFGIWLGPSLLATGRYRGEIAMGTGDTKADEVDRHLAGPEIRYRVDDGIDVFFGSWHTPKATSALHVDQFYAGITFKNTKLGRYQGTLGAKK